MEIFKLFGSIFVDTDAAERSMQKIEKAAEKLGNGIVAIGDKLSDVGEKLTKTVTVGVSALGIASVKSASTFEDAMAKVSTIADESEMSMGEMERAILDLSDQTGVSAAAIAEDVYNAISAGQKTADAVNFVSKSTKLARAGFADTGKSLDILTTIMNAYSMEASEVTRVSDVLIQTQNLGKTTVSDLASSMGKVIPTAKANGISIENLASMYAVMTANGIATAETTTYVNSMLNELGKQGTSAANAFAQGTEHIREGGLTMKEAMERGWDLTDVLSVLDEQAALSGTSIANMFGSAEAGKAASVLWDKAQQLNGVLGEMENSAGSTENAFGKLETTSYKVEKALNEGKNVLIDLGGTIIDMLVPYLEKGVEKVHEFADWFKGLSDGTKEMIVKIGLLVAAAGPLLAIIGKGISVVGNVISIGGKLASGIGGIIKIGGSLASGATKLVGLFSGAVTFVTGTLIPAISAIGAPVLIVVGVIGGLVAAGVALYKNWDAVKEWAGNVWGAIKDIVGGAVEKIKGFFTGIIDFVKDNWQGLLLLLVNPFAGAFKLLYDNCEQFRNFIDGFLEKIKEGFQKFVEKIKGFFMKIIDFVKDNWQGLLLLLVNPFMGAFKLLYDNCEQFRNFIDGFLEKIREGIKNFVDAVLNAISKAWESIKAVTETVFSAIKDFLSAIWDRIKAVVETAVDIVKTVISMAWETVKKVTETAFNAVSKTVSAIWNGIKKVIETVTGAIKSVVTTAWNAIADTVGRVIGGIKDAISNGLNAAKNIVSNILNGIKNKFQSIFDGAKNIVSGAIEKIKSFFRFEWSLPKIKLPHFKISGGFSLNPPSIPSFGVEWYKKGGIMMEPTKFGVNPGTGKDMVGGEAGPEAIAPIEILKEYIREAVSDRDDSVYAVLEAMLELLQEFLPRIPRMRVVLDSGALVGELADPMNEKLGEIIYKRRRQN